MLALTNVVTSFQTIPMEIRQICSRECPGRRSLIGLVAGKVFLGLLVTASVGAVVTAGVLVASHTLSIAALVGIVASTILVCGFSAPMFYFAAGMSMYNLKDQARKASFQIMSEITGNDKNIFKNNKELDSQERSLRTTFNQSLTRAKTPREVESALIIYRQDLIRLMQDHNDKISYDTRLEIFRNPDSSQAEKDNALQVYRQEIERLNSLRKVQRRYW